MVTCGSCGEQNPERARFCLGCGRPLGTEDGEDVRKLVTVLFADVVGSTDLGERMDPERYRSVLAGYFDQLRAIVVHHGGTVEKFIGDAVMAVFGVPVAHEDDALRAVRAAAEIDRLVRRLETAGGPGDLLLRWRIGVNTGVVSAGGAGHHTFATGDAVNVAARLEQAAGPGEVLLGGPTYELVRDAVHATRVDDLRLRGKSTPIPAYRLEGVDETSAGRRRRFDQPFVGRDEERHLLTWAARRSLTRPAVQLVTICGDAGIGKTRLAGAALEGLDAPVAWGRCLPYGDGVTYWPLTEALLELAGVASTASGAEITDRLIALVGERLPRAAVATATASLGLTGDAVADDPARSLRDLVLAIAEGRGLVLVVDDLHDAEAPLLDLLASLVHAHDVPLLLVGIARPELLLQRPDWGGGVSDALTFTLEPLPPEHIRSLLESRLEGPLDSALEEQLTQAAGGNPLYLEEVVTVLLDAGDLRRDTDGVWRTTHGGAPLAVPVSIQALLAARIDALPATHRRLLGRAAVCGLTFTPAALRAVTPEVDRDLLSEGIAALVDNDLLRPDAGGYAFRHRFARDAVYAGLSRGRRAELHERLATWLDAEADSPQSDEFVAYHLQRALEERTSLDPGAPELARLRADASLRFGEAGRRAFDRRDVMAAVRLLGQALATVDADGDRRRAQLLATRGRALAETGDFESAIQTLSEAVDVADRLGDRILRTHTRLNELWVRSNLDLGGWVAEARAAAEEAIEVFADEGDELGLARAWGLLGEVEYLQSRYEAARESTTRAEAYALSAGDHLEARDAAIAAVFAQLPGPRHLDEADQACRDLLDRFAGDRPVEARALHMLATIHALRGDGPAARACLGGAVERFEELGQGYWTATSAAVEGVLESLVGTSGAAETAFRRGFEGLAALGDRAQAATVAAQLARVLDEQRTGDIADLVIYAREHGHVDDLECRVHTLLASAHLAASHGDLTAADRATEEALAALEPSDATVLRVDALLVRADVLQRTGDPAERATAARRARELAVTKGYTVGAQRAERLLTGGGVPDGAEPSVSG